MTIAQKVYLDLLVARNYPDQEPAYIAAKWYHLFWFLVPVIGFLIFYLQVKESYQNSIK